MFGGELLATGSSSCVFKPSLPCDLGGDIYDDKISKVIFSEKSSKVIKTEKKSNEMIRRIKGYDKWAITFEKYCKPMKMVDILKYDNSGMIDCEEGMDDLKLLDFDDNSQMLIGEYGGDTLDAYISKLFKESMDINKTFLQIMNMIKPLFIGLEAMHKNNICHNDIKYNNIVFSDNGFKYIDFGLSDNFKNIDHFKKRAQSEFNTKRFYVFYPIEYIYSLASDRELYNEMTRKRKNLNRVIYLSKIFNRDYNEDMNDIINRIVNDENDIKEVIKGIDTYSLGVVIPLLMLNIFENEIYDLVNSNNIIGDFFELFGKMAEPDYKNRISPSQSFKLFQKLLDKYNGVKRSRKPKKTRKPRKPRKPKKTRKTRNPRKPKKTRKPRRVKKSKKTRKK